MKILYDGEIYSIFRRGGVIRYFHNLIARLPRQCHPLVLGNDEMPESPDHPNLRQHVHANRWVPKPLKFVRKSLDRRYCRARFRSLAPDIIHPTYFQNVAKGRYDRREVPLVLTVYDMIHERFAAEIDRNGKHSQLKRDAVRRADHLICISETTRQDLIERFGIPESRTSVTLLGVEPQFSDPAALASHHDLQGEWWNRLSAPYFVFVGRRDLYKNWDRLLKAFQQVQATHPEIRLAVVGSRFGPEEQLAIDRLGLTAAVVHLGAVNDPTLVAIYRKSLGFVFPTLWEGFGLPLLEGIASGTCVLASDIQVFREIAAGGFEPFDPYDPESIAQAMLIIASDPEHRQQIIQRGQQLLPAYNWADTAARTFEIYQNVTGIMQNDPVDPAEKGSA